MSVHDAIAAVPVSGTPNRGLLQSLLIDHYIYVLDAVPAENEFDPTGEGGSIVQGIGITGVAETFWLDPDDSTTAHDGTTCIVGANGERYKIDGTDYLVHSVLDKDLTDPPLDPELGDAYLVPPGSSGDWATKADNVALWTSRGWVFIAPKPGRLIYVEDEDAYYRWTGSAWVQGFGQNALGANSVPLSTTINFGHFVRVENQTTNAPPSVAQGVAYIIGAAPTGAWAGQSGKVAIREMPGSGNVFTIYDPPAGMLAYDKAEARNFQFNGSAWIPASGNFEIGNTKFYTSSDTWTKPAQLIGVRVHLIGAGGGGAANGSGGNGSASSFNGVSADFGDGGSQTGSNGAGGTATGDGLDGDQGGNTDSTTRGQGGASHHPWGGHGDGGFAAPGYGGGGASGTNLGARAGGGGAYEVRWMDAGDLDSGEAVTVGSPGSAGTGGGRAGGGGLVVIEEYIAQ